MSKGRQLQSRWQNFDFFYTGNENFKVILPKLEVQILAIPFRKLCKCINFEYGRVTNILLYDSFKFSFNREVLHGHILYLIYI